MLNVGNLGGVPNEHLMQKLAWQMVNLPMETANAFGNWYLSYGSEHPEAVEEMRELLAMSPGRVQCLSNIKKGSGPIVVIGSGSSLDAVVPTLKDWKGAVMCSTSQASTLVRHGRPPDYVVCLDPRVAPSPELAAPDWGDAVFLGHVSVPPVYVAQWVKRARGNVYLGRIMEPSYDWYSHHLGRGYPWIRHVMMPMIDSGAAEIGLATWLGYSPIYIVGLDYGGPRFDQYNWDYDKKEWTLDHDTSKLDMATLGKTNIMSYASRGSLMSAFLQITNEKYRQRIYNLSDRSALVQFPKAKWESVLNGEPEGGYDARKVLDEIEMALAVWDTFLVPMQGGWGIDYITYIAKEEEQLYGSLIQHNKEVANNVRDFAKIEKEQGQPIQQMIEAGNITLEAGELLLHGAEEFQDWDWHKIRPVDILMVCLKRRWLLEEAAKRGYHRDNLPLPVEMKPGDVLPPDVQQVVAMNKEAAGG